LAASKDTAPTNLAWESTVDIVSNVPAMKLSIFYRVIGFFEFKRVWYAPWRKKAEIVRTPREENNTSVYKLPMGKAVTLKLLFYKSEKSWRDWEEIKKQKLEIKTKSDAFAGFSQETIPVLSRYNEELIQIACKRVFDSVFAPISIELKKEDDKDPNSPARNDQPIDLLAPQPYLITKVTVPWRISVGVIISTLAASLLLTFSPDVFTSWGDYFNQQGWLLSGAFIKANPFWLTNVAKSAGAVCTLFAAYLAFRKLPFGGK
jgi:hypothetical protein